MKNGIMMVSAQSAFKEQERFHHSLWWLKEQEQMQERKEILIFLINWTVQLEL